MQLIWLAQFPGKKSLCVYVCNTLYLIRLQTFLCHLVTLVVEMLCGALKNCFVLCIVLKSDSLLVSSHCTLQCNLCMYITCGLFFENFKVKIMFLFTILYNSLIDSKTKKNPVKIQLDSQISSWLSWYDNLFAVDIQPYPDHYHD